jgi:hypothetical protein
MMKLLSPQEVVLINIALSMPDSKAKLIHLKVLKQQYKDCYLFCAFKPEFIRLDTAIESLEVQLETTK